MSENGLMRQPRHMSTRGNLRELFKKYLLEDSNNQEFTWDSLTTENGLPHNWIYDLYQGTDGRIYIGTWGGGLAVISGEEWQIYTKKNGLYSNAVTCIKEDHSGRIWLATDNGLNILDQGVIKDGGLTGKSLLNMTFDKNNNLWVGCWRASLSGGGLFQYDGCKWRSYTTNQDLPGQEILKVFEDSIGRIWVGTYDQGVGAGVGCYDGKRWQNYTSKNGLANNCVYSMFEDPSGNMWFGTLGGVTIFEDRKWHKITKKDGLIDNRVYCMFIDRDQKMWFGTEKGLNRFDGKNWLAFTIKDGLVDNLVRAIMETQNGDLWFGTYPYHRGKGGISIAKMDNQKKFVSRVFDLLPEPPNNNYLSSGKN